MDTLRGGESSLSNTNKLIRFYEGATGLKTGSTNAAQYCLSATAERDGMELIAVILKSPTSPQRFESAKVLLNYGFAAYTLVTADPPQPLRQLPVTLGDAPAVQVRLEGENTFLTTKSKAAGIEVQVELEERLDAPVEAGDRKSVV